MKKFLALILALAFVLSLTACSKKGEEDRLEAIKKRGYIELCTEPYFAPNEFIDPSKSGDDQYVGMDIEFAKYIADKIGVELKIVPLDFSAVLAGITDGKYDMAISAIAYSPSRAEAMSLSKGYFFGDSGYGFLAREGEAEKYTTLEEAKKAVIVTQSGSVQEAIYQSDVKECKEFKLVANMTDGYLAVAEGKADLCLCSLDSAELYAQANGGLAITPFQFETDPELNSVRAACPLKGSDSLIEVINECIDELNEAGKFVEWNEYYREYAKKLGID